MNIFYITIFDIYYNDQKCQIGDEFKRFNGAYKTKSSEKKLISNLKEIIMEHKNDGLIIESNCIGRICFINIKLLLGIEENHEINYIKKYLNNNYEKTDDKIEHASKDVNNIIFLSFEEPEEDTLDNIIKVFDENNFDDYITTSHIEIYEWGAGSFFHELLIGIGVDTSKKLFKKIYLLIRNKGLDGKVNIHEKIRTQASEILGYRIDNYDVLNFYKTDEGCYNIVLRNLYEELDIMCNQKLNIIKLDKNKLTN